MISGNITFNPIRDDRYQEMCRGFYSIYRGTFSSIIDLFNYDEHCSVKLTTALSTRFRVFLPFYSGAEIGKMASQIRLYRA